MARVGLSKYIKLETLQDILTKPAKQKPSHSNNLESLREVFD